MKNSRHPQYSSPLLINSWTAATQSLLLNQSLVDLYYILNYTVNFYWYKYIRHLRHSVNSLWVSGNRKEWRNDNGKYEKKGKDNDAYYMNKPGTIWVILSSRSLFVFLSRWMMQWALSCHGSTLSVWSSSDPSSFSIWFWVCWAGRFCLCLCLFVFFYFILSFLLFLLPVCLFSLICNWWFSITGLYVLISTKHLIRHQGY